MSDQSDEYGDPASDRPLELERLKGARMPLPCDGFQLLYQYGVDLEERSCARCGFARWAHEGMPMPEVRPAR